MSARPQPRTRMSPQEYLERERLAEHKSEYYNGEVFAMSGGTRNHVLLCGNIQFALRTALAGRECTVFQSDMRVHVDVFDLYTYPDVVVVCGEERYLNARQDTLLNPLLIVEVLSTSTEHYDRGQKFAFYRALDALREYVLVAQDRRSVEVFRKNEAGRWELYEADDAHGSVELASVGCTLRLDDVYAGVRFEEAA